MAQAGLGRLSKPIGLVLRLGLFKAVHHRQHPFDAVRVHAENCTQEWGRRRTAIPDSRWRAGQPTNADWPDGVMTGHSLSPARLGSTSIPCPQKPSIMSACRVDRLPLWVLLALTYDNPGLAHSPIRAGNPESFRELSAGFGRSRQVAADWRENGLDVLASGRPHAGRPVQA